VWLLNNQDDRAWRRFWRPTMKVTRFVLGSIVNARMFHLVENELSQSRPELHYIDEMQFLLDLEREVAANNTGHFVVELIDEAPKRA
jgi:hypothetical protein